MGVYMYVCVCTRVCVCVPPFSILVFDTKFHNSFFYTPKVVSLYTHQHAYLQ